MSRDRAILLSLEKEASDIDKMKFKIKSYNLSLQGDQINFKVAFNMIFLSSSYVLSFFLQSILFHFIIISFQYFSLSYVLFSFHFCYVILVNKSKQYIWQSVLVWHVITIFLWYLTLKSIWHVIMEYKYDTTWCHRESSLLSCY